MSQLPQVRRLLVEDFMDQKDWIAKLFTPINNFMDGVTLALDRGISIRDNMAADIKTVTVNYVPTELKPIKVQWNLPSKPIAVLVGNTQRTNLAYFFPATTVGIQWKYSAVSGLILTDLIGITPTDAEQYILTLVIFTG